MENVKLNRVVPPEWMTENYVRDALRKGLKDSRLEFLRYEIGPATAVGDNYTSQMFLVRSMLRRETGKDENLNIIIKIMPTGSYGALIKEAQLFRVELAMYGKTLPAIDTLLEKAYPGHPLLHARCYHSDTDPAEFIAVEDLRKEGFRVADRLVGLDSDHIKLVIPALAKLHAASLVLARNDPETKQLYNDPVWRVENSFLYDLMFRDSIVGYHKLIDSWEDCPEKEKRKRQLSLLEKDFFEKTMAVFKRDDDAIDVLLHGDCWTNNIMFRYEGSQVAGIKFVDFQETCYGNPVLDLIYFLFTSCRDEVRFGDVDELLQIYHETFTETLRNLHFETEKQFTFEVLKKEFRKKLYFGLSSLFLIHPITIVPPSEVPDPNQIVDGEHDMLKVYCNPVMNGVLKKALPFFEKHGILPP